MSEVVVTPEIKHGTSLHIERGELAGYVARVGGGNGMYAPFAAFSNSDDLLKWLEQVFARSAALSPNRVET
jgi:hypothetical protein